MIDQDPCLPGAPACDWAALERVSRRSCRVGCTQSLAPPLRRVAPFPGICVLFLLGMSRDAAGMDCDRNGLDDAVEIEQGQSADCNANGIPDACDVSASRLELTAAPTFVGRNEAYSLSTADFDGDGLTDVVITDHASDRVVLRFGRGNADLSAEIRLQAAAGPASQVARDLDSDGDVDLAVACNVASKVAILSNQGDGSFAGHRELAAGKDPLSLAAGDFDDNGVIDLATANQVGRSISIFMGLGGAVFGEALTLAFEGQPIRIISGRIDGDALDDLAVAEPTGGGVAILLSEGAGAFRRAGSAPGASLALDLELADLDSDGDADLVTASFISERLTVALGKGDGSFGDAVDVSAGPGPGAVETADLDGDHVLDLVVASPGFLHVLRGAGDGTFQATSSLSSVSDPFGLELADFNGDDDPDLIVASLSGDFVLFESLPAQEFRHATLLEVGLQPYSVVSADFTGDAIPDLVTGDANRGPIQLLAGLGGGSFAAPGDIELPHQALVVRHLELDGNGNPDLVAMGDNNLSTLINAGGGRFRVVDTRRQEGLLANARPAVEDLDGDAVPDLATVVERDGSGVVALFALGSGGEIHDPVLIQSAPEPHAIGAGDIDGDGVADLAVGGRRGKISVHLGLGRGRFRDTEELALSEANFLNDLLLGDLDADGALELAVASGEGATIFRGDGKGSFLPALPLLQGAGGRAIGIADMDEDGILDLVGIAESVAILPGAGGGSFREPHWFYTGDGAIEAAIADLDGDGRKDIAVACAPFIEDHFHGVALVFNRTAPPSSSDCNRNGVPDGCDLSGGSSLDRDGDGTPDECQPDCDRDGVPDVQEILDGAADVDLDGRPDACERDCNGNLSPDDHDIESGVSADVDRNRAPDECQSDCNHNAIPDPYEIDAGLISDIDGNSRPDDCDPDCNHNNVPDVEDLRRHDSLDANRNHAPDECDIASGASRDVNGNGIPDEAETDCDGNGIPDLAEILDGLANDRNHNRRIDSCDIALGLSLDVDADGVPDEVQPDCNRNRIPDSHEVATGEGADCDGDGVLDECALATRPLEVESPARFPADQEPDLIRSADLDLDGRDDLILTDVAGNAPVLSVLLGRGVAGFQRLDPFVLDDSYRRFVVEDLDRDRIPDFAGLASGRDSQGRYFVTVRRGMGDGTFGEATHIPVGRGPLSFIVLDSDGDGILDLLTANRESFDVTLLRGRGDGTFEEARSFRAEASPAAVAAADLDGDGDMDLALVDGAQPAVLVLPGDGSAGFLPPITSPVRGNPTLILIEDLDADGIPDAAAGLRESRDNPTPGISFLKGKGDGTFTDTLFVAYPLFLESMQAADLEPDGDPDLVLVSSGPGAVSLLSGRSGLSFAPVRHFFAGLETRSAAVLDLDFDGSLDIVAVNSKPRDLSFLISNGPGSLAAPKLAPVQGGIAGVAAADLNGDEWTDFVLAKGDSLELLLGGPDGLFASGPSPSTGDEPAMVAVGDLNQDGSIDLALANSFRSRVATVLLGNGDATFGPASQVQVGDRQRGIAIADFESDGKPDLLVMTGERVSILAGHGDGTFDAARDAAPGYSGVSAFLIEDFDANGRPDLAIPPGEGSVHILLQTQSGAFVRKQILRLEDGNPEGLAAADLNGDGALDLTASIRNANSVAIATGKGNGTFAAPSYFPVAGQESVSITAFDMDHDGRIDVVTGDFANGAPGSLSLLRGTGDGGLEAPVAVPTGRGPISLLPVDLDHDGWLDLALTIRDPACLLLFHVPTRPQRNQDCNSNNIPDACELESGALADRDSNGIPDVCQSEGCQVPGDCNQDGHLDLTDGVCILEYLFAGRPATLPCGDGSISDPANLKLLNWRQEDGLNLSDAIATFTFLFLNGSPHPLSVPGEEKTGCIPIEGCPRRP